MFKVEKDMSQVNQSTRIENNNKNDGDCWPRAQANFSPTHQHKKQEHVNCIM